MADGAIEVCCGRVIGTSIGNYIVREKIGEGGMGAVYLAEHARIGKRVAVKVLLPHMSRDPQIVARFFNEAKAASDIANEHIVDILDCGALPDGASYILMEWLEGQSLATLLQRVGKLPMDRAARIARGIARALGAAHARGIVHRDLKPDNIFLVPRENDADFVKVLDFGIAKLAVSDAGDVRTQAGAIMGTPAYMSPEQCNGAVVDHRTDVYAMGVILYQMLTGALPFSTPKLAELLMAHATQKPPTLRSHDPTIPPAIEGAVLQALEKDPELRFHSVEALARAFGGEELIVAPAMVLAPVAAVGAMASIAPATTPASAPAAAAPSTSKTAAEIFVRVGLRGRQPLALLASATAIGVVLLAALLLRRGPEPQTPAATAPTHVGAASQPDATPSAASTEPRWAGRWHLAHTDCPHGSVPASVETTRNGSAFVTRAHGFPEFHGTAEADGRFHGRNASGSCSGRVTDRTVTETCTNVFGMSCHATYERSDSSP